MCPRRYLQPNSTPTWRYYPLYKHRHYKQYVEHQRLEGVEPSVTAQRRISDNAQIKGEEGDEAGVGDGVVEREERKEGLEGK